MAAWLRRGLKMPSFLGRVREEVPPSNPAQDISQYEEDDYLEDTIQEVEGRRIIGNLEVTIFQNVDIELYGSLQQRTFDFIVHEGPEEILKLFMHIHGRSFWGRRGKHVATALVPITHAIESGSDSRMVQLIVQPGNQTAATIFVDLKFIKAPELDDDDSDCDSLCLEDAPVLVVPAGSDECPQLAIPDRQVAELCRSVALSRRSHHHSRRSYE